MTEYDNRRYWYLKSLTELRAKERVQGEDHAKTKKSIQPADGGDAKRFLEKTSMNDLVKAPGVGDHPAEDTFVSLHTPLVYPVPLPPAVDRCVFSDDVQWDSPLPPHMRNTGKPTVDIHSAVSRDNERQRQALERADKAAAQRLGGHKIYLAGPMTGIREFNFPTFNAAAYMLRRHGHEVFNPAERDIERHGGINISLGNETGDPAQAARDHGFSLREALRDDTHYICMEATAIAMLPGWKGSKGANAEHELAHTFGLEMFYLGGFYA